MNHRCGCCEGTRALTPVLTANRPGLDALRYRAGTHAMFFQTMVARLSSHELEHGLRPLQRLTTRATDDPAIALLDAWATVADVLTFYQERIANEGYLLTATERRSILELARLVGYRLRPGVAASVYLAFTLEKDFEIEVPAGTRAQSIPEPGEQPQVFETDEPLAARTAWNAIPARQTRPSFLQPDATFDDTRGFWLAGALTNLKPNHTVLFVCSDAARPYTVVTVAADAAAGRTLVSYAPFKDVFVPPAPIPGPFLTHGVVAPAATTTLSPLASIVQALRKEPSLPPASRSQLARSPGQTYQAAADIGPQLLVHFTPGLKDTLYAAYANAPVTGVSKDQLCHVEAMRVKAAPFGHNAPQRLIVTTGSEPTPGAEWPSVELSGGDEEDSDQRRLISLDAVYESITPGSWVVIDRADAEAPVVAHVQQVRTLTRADYGISAKVTQLLLSTEWLNPEDQGATIGFLRGTTVYAGSEELPLAEEPIGEDVADDTIELDGLYDGLDAGRWLVVSGVRTDVPGLGGENEGASVEASELVMLAGATHEVQTLLDGQGNPILDESGEPIELPGDTLHTRLILAEPLAYAYRRNTVEINANVARATHGETRNEVLGSGNGSQAFQQFTLKQRPLTHVAAPTPSGVESTLTVRINQVRWPEQETLLDLGPANRGYVTSTDDDGRITVTFGDGKRGARLPSGVENVTAVYRSGIGKGGNAAAEQISVLATRPLGVKEVVNPQRASGGADPESRDQARRNVPLAVLALDRLVSVQDYADFTRTFAGIGKASAAGLSDGRRAIVHLTIAGADDIPIDVASDLFRNLMLALSRFGDPNTPLHVELREAVFLVISARVRVLEDYLWTDVEPKLRTALLNTFGFERRELGQDVLLSEVIGTMQAVEGVAYVDVDLLDGVSETDAADPETLATKLEGLTAGDQPKQRVVVHMARIDPVATHPSPRIRRAQLAYLNPELPDTLLLTEVTS